MLEGDVSDVISLDQLTSLFFTSESDKDVALIFLQSTVFLSSIYMYHQLKFDQHTICLVYKKNRHMVEDPSR